MLVSLILMVIRCSVGRLENFDNYALFKTINGWDDNQIDDSGNIRVDEDGVPIKSWASGFEARYPDDGNKADTSDLKAFAK